MEVISYSSDEVIFLQSHLEETVDIRIIQELSDSFEAVELALIEVIFHHVLVHKHMEDLEALARIGLGASDDFSKSPIDVLCLLRATSDFSRLIEIDNRLDHFCFIQIKIMPLLTELIVVS